MTEIIKINWLLLVAPFLWISGVAVLIAQLGHMEFLCTSKKRKRREFLKKPSFKTSMWVSTGLIASGLLLYAAKIPSNKLIVVKIDRQNAIPLRTVLNDPIRFSPQELKMDSHNRGHIINNEKMTEETMVLFWDGYIESPFLQFKKGLYTLEFQAKGSKAEEEFSQLKVEFEIPDKNDYMCTSSGTYIELTGKMKTYRFHFQTGNDTIGRIRIGYFNDLYVPNTKEGRDVWIKELTISINN